MVSKLPIRVTMADRSLPMSGSDQTVRVQAPASQAQNQNQVIPPRFTPVSFSHSLSVKLDIIS